MWRGLADRPRHGSWGRYQDPVFGYVPLAPLLRQALDLGVVQRLRGIKQLSGLDLIFPGATHTRFEHSVGVMWLAGEAHQVLTQKAPGHPEWPQLSISTQLAVMLAGLCHDLGHGPYSHTYEMFLEREPEPGDLDASGEARTESGPKHTPPHMKATKRIILNDPELGTFLRQVAARLRELKHPQDGLVEPEQIARLAINEPLPGPYRDYSFLGQIISGEFDVDRLDYLRRDSVHTGVPMGVDTGEILAAYTIARVSAHEPDFSDPPGQLSAASEEREPDGELAWALKLDWIAAEAFEGMLVARDTAYRRLYYQRGHRSGQEMLILALQRLTRRPPEPPVPQGGAIIPPGALALKDDQELLGAVADQRDSLLFVLYEAWKQRRLYEPLPYAVRIHEWRDDVRLRLEEQLRVKGNRVLREAMRATAAEVGMILENDDFDTAASVPPERVLVDITKVPVSGAAAYRGRWLWNERDGQLVSDVVQEAKDKETKLLRRTGWSLNELLPHMNALHGILPGGGNAHRDYTAQMQTVLIFVPGSFMERIHVKIVEARKAASADAVADEIFRVHFGPILTALYEVLVRTLIKPPAQSELLGGMERELRRWLASEQAFPNDGAREIWAPFP